MSLVAIVFVSKFMTDFVVLHIWTDPNAIVPTTSLAWMALMSMAALLAVSWALRQYGSHLVRALELELTPVQQRYLLWSVTAELRAQGECELAERVARLAERKEKATSGS